MWLCFWWFEASGYGLSSPAMVMQASVVVQLSFRSARAAAVMLAFQISCPAGLVLLGDYFSGLSPCLWFFSIFEPAELGFKAFSNQPIISLTKKKLIFIVRNIFSFTGFRLLIGMMY